MANLVRRFVRTETVEVVETVVAAPVPMSDPEKKAAPSPALPTNERLPVIGHIIKAHDGYADRPGGRLPIDGLYKIVAVTKDGKRFKVAGLRGTPGFGREGWLNLWEMEYVRG